MDEYEPNEPDAYKSDEPQLSFHPSVSYRTPLFKHSPAYLVGINRLIKKIQLPPAQDNNGAYGCSE